jgi:hypothetical protein
VSNRTRIVSDEELEKALSWLRDNAKEIGDAKAELVRASHMVKVTKALSMRLHNEKPISHQEREALASEEYRTALERDAVAAGEYEKLRALREAAALKIEAWRSEQANYRALRI